MELTIGIQNKETTEAGTLIITMNPVNTAKWIATPELIEAEIAVQSYGVISIPNYEDLDASSLMCYVSLDFVTYQAALADIIAGAIGDVITFSGGGGGGGGANDAEIAKMIEGSTYSLFDSSASFVASSIFSYNSKMTGIETAASIVYNGAFQSCNVLAYVSLPEATLIGSSAFARCYSLKSVYAPKLTTISDAAFSSCTALESFTWDNVESIGDSAFWSCTALTDLNMPKVTRINTSAFAGANGITAISAPLLTSFFTANFDNKASLTTIYMPLLDTLPMDAFKSCTALSQINLPKISYVVNSAFYNCTNLESVRIGAETTGKGSLFAKCFDGCVKLSALYIEGTSVFNLTATALSNTPMFDSSYLGVFGSIYVKPSLVSSYIASGAWAAFSERITAIPENADS